LKNITVKKGEILQHKGDFNPKIYIVHEGLLRSYSIDKKGKEHIFMFAPEGWIIADASAGTDPAELFIEALEDSKISVTEREPSRPNVDSIPLLRRISVLQKRVIMLMSSSAIQRYDHFIETYPNIVQRVPQRMIASYLGITPEALSKVKGERVRKGK
jgi:CRP-like cAMP-binding protein